MGAKNSNCSSSVDSSRWALSEESNPSREMRIPKRDDLPRQFPEPAHQGIVGRTRTRETWRRAQCCANVVHFFQHSEIKWISNLLSPMGTGFNCSTHPHWLCMASRGSMWAPRCQPLHAKYWKPSWCLLRFREKNLPQAGLFTKSSGCFAWPFWCFFKDKELEVRADRSHVSMFFDWILLVLQALFWNKGSKRQHNRGFTLSFSFIHIQASTTFIRVKPMVQVKNMFCCGCRESWAPPIYINGIVNPYPWQSCETPFPPSIEHGNGKSSMAFSWENHLQMADFPASHVWLPSWISGYHSWHIPTVISKYLKALQKVATGPAAPGVGGGGPVVGAGAADRWRNRKMVRWNGSPANT